MASVAGLLTWLRTYAGISAEVLPDTSPYLYEAYATASDLTNTDLNIIPRQYDNAVYNLTTHVLLNWCPDQPGQTFFATLRTKYNLNGFTAGVVSASSDESTSVTLTSPDIMKNLNFNDLDLTKTPFGRAYMQAAGQFGNLYGVS